MIYRWSARFVLVLSLLVCLLWSNSSSADPCASQEKVVTNNGQCWRSLTGPEKAGIIQGIWMGQRVQSKSLEMAADTGTVNFGVDWASVPDGTTIGDITSYFDRLYETPANRQIKWDNAYLLAALNARDDDENDRLSLLTFLRSNDELPTFGALAGVKSANVLEIRSGSKTFDVKLSGIRVPPKISEAATTFLKGLGTAALLGNCKSSEPTPVTLYYRTELFDGDGQLTADVRIDSIYQICVAGAPVALGGEGSRFTNVGYFLLQNGLAEVDSHVDQKWSDERRRFVWTDTSVDAAREAKLYLYGDQTSPIVEMVSGHISPTHN